MTTSVEADFSRVAPEIIRKSLLKKQTWKFRTHLGKKIIPAVSLKKTNSNGDSDDDDDDDDDKDDKDENEVRYMSISKWIKSHDEQTPHGILQDQGRSTILRCQ